MRTKIYTIISIAVLPFVLFSCNKSESAAVVSNEDLETIHAIIPATKVGAVEVENGLDWVWQEGDNLTISSGEIVSSFFIDPEFKDPKNAAFIGQAVRGESFSIQYPGNTDLSKLVLDNQKQEGNNTLDHLRYFALLSGVNNYKVFSFSDEWAKQAGGSFKQNGVLRLALTMPSAVTSATAVEVLAGSPLFHAGNNAEAPLVDKLTVELSEIMLNENKTLVVWLTTSWFADVLPAGTELTITVASDAGALEAKLTLEKDCTVSPGYVNRIAIEDASSWAVSGSRYAGGKGTETEPWLIATAQQLVYMGEDLAVEEMRYFKLVDNIDLDGIEWQPMNASDPYKKYVSFDGDNYTISNLTISEPTAFASFAGVLYGTIQNVIFDKASINGGTNSSAVVAGSMGTNAAFIPSLVKNVTVTNSTVTAQKFCGVVAGQVSSADASFEGCAVASSEVKHTGLSNTAVGGFVGIAEAAASYTNCSAAAKVTGTQYVGGFAGYLRAGTLSGCSSTSEVAGSSDIGGFAGQAESSTLENCFYAGAKVTTNVEANDAHCGGFIGHANGGNTFTGCYANGMTIQADNAYCVGGFCGKAESGDAFTKCYVNEADITAGLHAGGFVGMCSGQVDRCYVEGGRLLPSGAGAGDDGVGAAGFVAYTENAAIRNCYTTMGISGAEEIGIGGFLAFAKENTLVQFCYAAGVIETTITAADEGVGFFVDYVDDFEDIFINHCIGWSDSEVLDFVSWEWGGNLSDNYYGKEGTIGSQMQALGWDASIWNFETGKLK